MNRCLRTLIILFGLLQMPLAHASYKCVSELPTTTQSGTVATGISLYLTFDLYCTRLSTDTKINRIGVAYGILNVDNGSQATLRNTVGTTTYDLPFTIRPVVTDTNTNSNTLVTTGPSSPTCASTGAPTGLQSWIYAQTQGNTSPTSSTLLFANNAAVTTTRPRYLTLCLYIPPPTSAIPSGTYSRSMKLTSAITSVVSNVIGGTDLFTVSVVVANTCSVSSSLGTLAIPYTSFATAAGTASVPVLVGCSTGALWSAALSAPTTGTLRNIAYELGLGTAAGVSPVDPLTTSLSNQSGTATIYLHGRAAAGQVGSQAPCSPCDASHALTITY